MNPPLKRMLLTLRKLPNSPAFWVISAPPVSIARVCWISSPAVAIAEAEFVNPVPRSAELVAKLFNLLLSDLQNPTDHNFIMAISHFWLIPTFHF